MSHASREVGGGIDDNRPLFELPREVRNHRLPVTGIATTSLISVEDQATRGVTLGTDGRDWIRTTDGHAAVRPRHVTIVYVRPAGQPWQVLSASVRGPARADGYGGRLPNQTITWKGAALNAVPAWLAHEIATRQPTDAQGAF